MVRTVLGDIEPSALGITLTHEHLLITFDRWKRQAGEAAGARQPADDPRASKAISLETVGWVRRNWPLHPENSRLTDQILAMTELQRFKDAGGRTVVDATNPDLDRNAGALARIAAATGVQIVMGTGRYVETSHPLDMAARSEDELYEEVVRDVTEGADGTAVKSGIIGEIGCSAPLHGHERKALRAAARAQAETGAPLLLHPGRAVSSPLELIAIVADAGGDPARTIMSHIDRTVFDLADMTALAQTGCTLEFDLFGQESSYYPLSPIDMPNDATRVDHLIRLTDAGFGTQIVIAHDICRKTSLCAYGGEGYTHILENIVPLMRRKGMTQAQIDAILIQNPARLLAMAK